MEMTSRDRKALIVLGCVALVALLLFVFVLRKGGSSTETVAPEAPVTTGAPVAAPPVSPQPEPSPSPSKSPDASDGQPSISGTDPFEPLVAVNGGTTDTSGDTTDTTTQDTTTSPSPEPSPAPTTSPDAGSGSTATIDHGGHIVELVGFESDGSEKTAIVAIDGTKYTVKAGDDIAFDFKLMSVTEPCADFVHVTHPFTLCVT